MDSGGDASCGAQAGAATNATMGAVPPSAAAAAADYDGGAGAPAAPATGFNDLSPACFLAVFGRLSAMETARAMCVHSLWRDVLCDDALWRQHLCETFARADARLPGSSGSGGTGGGTGGQGAAAAATGGCAAATSSPHRVAFRAWAAHFAGLPRPLVRRAVRMWAELESWMRENAPFVADTLRPGATAGEVAAAEAALGTELPPALAAILRTHDGQQLEYDAAFDAYVDWRMAPGDAPAPPPPPRWHASMVAGLFGAYAFYDHLASVRLLPLARLVRWTLFFRAHAHAPLPAGLLVVGASANLGKLVLLDAATGAVLVGGAQDRLPAAPPDISPGSRDGALRWMEEWARRLQAGWYAVDPAIGADRRRCAPGVSLFPARAPHMATAVTRGLRVRVSAVFVPEMSGEGGARYFFGYRVRFALLPVAEQQQQQPAGQDGQDSAGPLQQCQHHHQQQQDEHHHHHQQQQQQQVNINSGHPLAQEATQQQQQQQQEHNGSGGTSTALLRRAQLESRHWRILDSAGQLSNEVAGEGVVGEFPLLDAGGPEYSYHSCTHQAERLGYMEGSFAFVEGTRARPEGPPVAAACPRFELRVPDFIY